MSTFVWSCSPVNLDERSRVCRARTTLWPAARAGRSSLCESGYEDGGSAGAGTTAIDFVGSSGSRITRTRVSASGGSPGTSATMAISSSRGSEDGLQAPGYPGADAADGATRCASGRSLHGPRLRPRVPPRVLQWGRRTPSARRRCQAPCINPRRVRVVCDGRALNVSAVIGESAVECGASVWFHCVGRARNNCPERSELRSISRTGDIPPNERARLMHMTRGVGRHVGD